MIFKMKLNRQLPVFLPPHLMQSTRMFKGPCSSCLPSRRHGACKHTLQISQPDKVQQAPTAVGISAVCAKCFRALMSLPKHTRPVHEQKYQMLLLDILLFLQSNPTENYIKSYKAIQLLITADMNHYVRITMYINCWQCGFMPPGHHSPVSPLIFDQNCGI